MRRRSFILILAGTCAFALIAVLARPIQQFLLFGTASIERTSGDGDQAFEWLDDSFSHEWTVNPFPRSRVIAIRGFDQGGRDKGYWLRVQFPPDDADLIIRGIQQNVRSGERNPVVIKRTSLGPPTDRSDPPFWKPGELGQNVITFHVTRQNPAGDIVGAMIDISISKEMGLAYIRYWEF